MARNDLAQARRVLNGFMLAMNQWERKFHRAKRDALDEGRETTSIDDEARNDLIAVFGKWACPDKTNEGRLIDLGCGDPPTYDLESDIEESAELRGNKALFTFRQTRELQSRFRFVAISREDEWKIEKKELLNYREKWQRSML